jgi:hypothetical protein
MLYLHRPPSVLPDISPSRGEIGSFAAVDIYLAAVEIGESKAAGVISPLEGEMSGRTEGGGHRHELVFGEGASHELG